MEEQALAAWDHWLEHQSLGQFQQTSRWARFKAAEGWQAERLWLDPGRPADGGLQILWKPTRFGLFGYVPKGPVVPGEDRAKVEALLQLLAGRARLMGLRGVILQPPDQSGLTPDFLHRHGYHPRPVPAVIRATATIDLNGGRTAWEARMHSKTRQQARAAAKRGVTVRAGGRADLPQFFALMEESCRRQNTRPNPSRVEALESLWDAFPDRIKVGFAWVDSEPIAGLLMIGHGDRLTFWKKGWNSRGAQLYANCLLMVEAMQWATEWGYATVDFAGLDPVIAATLLAGNQLTEEQQKSRDMFNLRLGSQPHLLPPAQLLVINPVLRQLHRLATTVPALEKKLMRKLGGG